MTNGEEGEEVYQGWPPNCDYIICARLFIPATLIIQLPDIPVPDDMFLQVKGWFTNANPVYVASTRGAALSVEQSWPLLANEAHGWKIKNANALWVSGTAGEAFVYSVEQRR